MRDEARVPGSGCTVIDWPSTEYWAGLFFSDIGKPRVLLLGFVIRNQRRADVGLRDDATLVSLSQSPRVSVRKVHNLFHRSKAYCRGCQEASEYVVAKSSCVAAGGDQASAIICVEGVDGHCPKPCCIMPRPLSSNPIE